jgi:hypothetical protein
VRRCGGAAACNPLCVDALQQQLGAGRSAAVLARQHLFSVYVHARPTLKDYPEGSIFHGRLIPDRAVRAAFVQPSPRAPACAAPAAAARLPSPCRPCSFCQAGWAAGA